MDPATLSVLAATLLAVIGPSSVAVVSYLLWKAAAPTPLLEQDAHPRLRSPSSLKPRRNNCGKMLPHIKRSCSDSKRHKPASGKKRSTVATATSTASCRS